MKTLGLLFILVGLWLCFTMLFSGAGATAIALGVLCYIAGRDGSRGQIARLANGSLWVLITLSLVFASVAFLGLAMGVKPTHRLSAHPLPVQRTEQNRVYPVKHAEPAKASPVR